MPRRIWIDPTIIESAIAPKEALDALALCCMIKLTFVDSMVKHATICKLMGIFHLSYGRCVKALEEGLRREYFIRDGEHLRASKVRRDEVRNVPIDLPAPESKDDCPVSIAKMCDHLRGALLYNHIAKQNDMRDTLRLARDCAPDELKQMKRARAKLRKKGMFAYDSSAEDGLRLSYARIASLLHICQTKAKAMVKQLIAQGLIERVHQIEETDFPPEEFTKQIRDGYSQYGTKGFMLLCGGSVCLQLANSYMLCGDSLARFLY